MAAAVLSLGPRPVDPTDVSWLRLDPSTHYLGWSFLRHDPAWRWPFTFTDRIGHPSGVSTSFFDAMPLALIFFRAMAPVLPDPFQYLGIMSIAACALQFYFGARLGMEVDDGRPATGLAVGMLMLSLPPFVTRFAGHFSLLHHWVIVCALWLYIRNRDSAGARWWASFMVLIVTAVGINPYLALMAMFIAGASLASKVWAGDLGWRNAGLAFSGWLAGALSAAWCFGLLFADSTSISGTARSFYALDLLGVFDPAGQSTLLPALPWFRTRNIETAIYFGVPGLLLTVLTIAYARDQVRRSRFLVVPLGVASCFAMILAISPSPSIAGHGLGRLWLPEPIMNALVAFRGSGRFAWLCLYINVLGGVMVLVHHLGRRAWLMVGAMAAIAAIEVGGLRAATRAAHDPAVATRLVDPIWGELGRDHDHLVVLPAWQCGHVASPGGVDGYTLFGFVALDQGMTLNSYYAGRFGRAQISAHCVDLPNRLRDGGADPRTAYVVDEAWSRWFRESAPATHACGRVEGFTLCVARRSAVVPRLAGG